ncbi:b66 [miniopterid betaherpesvirus 1]|uniref:B66 n=1 Tax=miniopterid betaherpesvirus 1 TaxID=3070189 RepID=I3VQ54_9BETA|nr:b66 [miniopterid betaherpesvirus 1]AFK83898.1 b66 [miniopterid betaherpesvirus 1]
MTVRVALARCHVHDTGDADTMVRSLSWWENTNRCGDEPMPAAKRPDAGRVVFVTIGTPSPGSFARFE